MADKCKSCRGWGVILVGDKGDTCRRCEGTGIEPTFQVYADGTRYKLIEGIVHRSTEDDDPFSAGEMRS